jgi:hypothetical protein
MSPNARSWTQFVNRFFSDDDDNLLDERTASWLILCVGVAAIAGVGVALRTGRIGASYRKFGIAIPVNVEREFTPVQFMIRVLMQTLVGIGLVFFGVYRLLH